MADEEYDFESGSANAAKTYPQKASSLKKGGFTMINNRPCKVYSSTTSKTGKHGCAKVHLTAIDLFTAKKLEVIFSSTDNIDVPHVGRHEMLLIDITDDDFCHTMDEKTGEMRQDVRLPGGDLDDKIRQLYDEHESGNVIIVLQTACDEEVIVDAKVARQES